MSKSIKSLSRFLSILIFITLVTQTQAQSTLQVIGTVESNMSPLSEAKVTLYKDGTEQETKITDHRGEFKLDMDLNSEYLIEIRRGGFYTKRIAFNTEVPEEVSGKWTMEFAMSLFKGCNGVDASALNDPVDRIKYSANQADFISDEAYVRTMRNRIQNLVMDIDKCQADLYQESVEEANKLIQQNNYADAIVKYEEALEIYPGDRTATRKLAEARKELGSSVASQQAYAKAIAEADQLYAEKNYLAAKTKYNAALRAKPDAYAHDRIAEIDKLSQEQYQTEQAQLIKDREYSSLIAKANAAVTSKDYAAAKQFYDQAALVKPDAAFPKQKSAEMNPLIAKQKQSAAEQQATDKAYAEAIAMGQVAMQKGDYTTAKQHYQRAMMMKPEQSLAREKIREAESKEEAKRMADMKAQKAGQMQKMETALDDGDALLAQKDYEGAAAAYQRALQLDPNDAYAQKQLNKSKSMQLAAVAEKQQALTKQYNATVSNGDNLLAANNYQQAITAYKQALIQKPNDPVVSRKLAEAEQMEANRQKQMANEQAKQREYETQLSKAGSLFANKQYAQAKQAYQSAATLYPTQSAPRLKIQEIDRILDEQKKQEQFKAFLAKGDGFMTAKNYVEAKAAYQQALAMNASNSYARQKISEIEGIEQQAKNQAEAQKVREAQYTRTIREADNYMSMSRNAEAKASYQRAMGYKPDDSYSKQQIAKIDQVLAEQLRKENEQKAKEQQYKQNIMKADQAFAAKNYELAKSAYQQALALKATDTYPRQKIAEIDEIIRKNQQLAAQQKALDMQYTQTIQQADNLLAAKNLIEAKGAYQKAAGIKTYESYPKAQITKIDGLIAEKARQQNEQRANEQKYNLEITKADKAFGQNNLTMAKQAYQNALLYKPSEAYPKTQIAKIDGLLAKAEKEKQAKAAVELKYQSLISRADGAYDQRDYPTAKSVYTEALSMKPSASYPQQRLNKIAEFERVIAMQNANRTSTKTSTATASKPKTGAPSKLALLNFKNDSERDKYLNGLKSSYPVGVTLEVHKEKTSTTHRYVIIRNGEARELRKVKFNWGGVEYTDNGIPTSGQYFDSQVKRRGGEAFQEFEF